MKYLIVALLALLPAFAISLRINPVTSVEEGMQENEIARKVVVI